MNTVKIAVIIALTGLPILASAGTIQAPISVSAMAQAGAVTAAPGMSGYAVNPAAIGFLHGSTFSADAFNVNPQFKYASGGGGNASVLADGFITHHFHQSPWSVGFSVTMPDVINAKWPSIIHVPPQPLYGPNFTFPPMNLAGNASVVDFSPTISYQIFHNLSAGIGLDYYQTLGSAFSSPLPGPTVGMQSAWGAGHGIGGTFGLQYVIGTWQFGADYKTGANVKLSRSSLFMGFYMPNQINIPGNWQAGIGYQVKKSLHLEADFTRTNWSQFWLLTVPRMNYQNSDSYALGVRWSTATPTIGSPSPWTETVLKWLPDPYLPSIPITIMGGFRHSTNPATQATDAIDSFQFGGNTASLGISFKLSHWRATVGGAYQLPTTGPSQSKFFGPSAGVTTSNMQVGISLTRHF
ncbi:hypothetical protein F6A13_03595 [Acidithiobacillus sp. 'AMD consortium']|uniref:OmpP1/FadL family transporter n=1 Tax=Acidithiobacillus sp. 'AMD consortium' TaxID=2614801 RepID=UPI00124D3CDC|nr:hypothetical protein [Acidithiobacillus sp. 'AMD consortium']QFG77820.1 hypothetical protein F6A13_03595 [Acidithiobacillus sp. 'AMD consortium']